MKGRVNNYINLYENERVKLKGKAERTDKDKERLVVVDEVLKVLFRLKGKG